jgi:hypothetical protein
MKRTIYLHIGTEKTGTTSIQRFLFNNKKILHEIGYHFIQSAGHINNRCLPSYGMDDKKHDDFFLIRQIDTINKKKTFREKTKSELEDEINSLPDSIHSIIISSEHFHSRTNTIEEIQRVKDLIYPFYDSIKIICYLREQSALCSSSYSTDIKAGRDSSFVKYSESCNTENVFYNYEKMLYNWSILFGIDNVCVRTFDKDKLINKNIIHDFSSQLNINKLNALNTEHEKSNVSLNHLGEILGRAINKVIPKYDTSGVIDKRRNRAIASLSDHFQGTGFSFNSEQSKKIFKEFQASNREVSRLYLKQEDDLFVYKEPSSTINVLKESDAEGISEALLEVVQTAALPNQYAELFRDTALMYESIDLEKAIIYMELAHKIRPKGPFIAKKLQEYRKRSD